MNQLQKENVRIELTTELKGNILIILKHYMDYWKIVDYENSPFSIDTLHGNQEWFAKVAQHLLFMHGYAIYVEGKIEPAGVVAIDTIVYDMWVAEVWQVIFQIKVKRYWKEHERNNELRLRHNNGAIPLLLLFFPQAHSPTDEELKDIREATLHFFKEGYLGLGEDKEEGYATGESSQGERKETSSGKYKKDNTNTLIF